MARVPQGFPQRNAVKQDLNNNGGKKVSGGWWHRLYIKRETVRGSKGEMIGAELTWPLLIREETRDALRGPKEGGV